MAFKRGTGATPLLGPAANGCRFLASRQCITSRSQRRPLATSPIDLAGTVGQQDLATISPENTDPNYWRVDDFDRPPTTSESSWRVGAWPLPGSFGWKTRIILSTFSINHLMQRPFLIWLTRGSSSPTAGFQATG